MKMYLGSRAVLYAGLAGFSLILALVRVATFARSTDATANSSLLKADGSVSVPAFIVPESALLSEETHNALKSAREFWSKYTNPCPSLQGATDRDDIPAIRRCQADAFYKTPRYRGMRDLYGVEITAMEIAGVHAEVFMPATGLAPSNESRVLINLHGGGFLQGSRTLSRLESIPIAAIGRIKVISVDYRMAPEYSFPAGREDVTLVYRELLKTYSPQSIGIYGGSAGGVLTAETVAWLLKEGLPAPGAVGMLSGAGGYWTEGDSGYVGAALTGLPPSGFSPKATREDPYFRYFKDADPNDPLVFPIRSSQVLAGFPPSLLITSTRDVALSSVVGTHTLLVKEGVDAELHVFDGLGHAFFLDAALPESRQAYDITVKFFDRHLRER